jgi:hypothetical protein
MRTAILAHVIAGVGLAMTVIGGWALLALLFDETVKVHLTHYAAAVGILSGGLSMVGLAQALRLLFEIRGALPSQLEGPRRWPGAL